MTQASHAQYSFMNKNILLSIWSSWIILCLVSCGNDNEGPSLSSAQVSVRNTLQTAADPSLGGTGGTETPIEAIFGLPEGALALSTIVGDDIEFQGYLDGLYDIDLSDNSISYNLVAPANHPVYSNFFRTIEANTFDRYYFTFSQAHQINSGTSDDPSVSLSILSATEILIEIGEGFSFNPGSSFTININ